jgi:molybdate transport system permease protein
MSETRPTVLKPRQLLLIRLFSLPILAFISLPLLALFLRISPARLLANLQEPQVLLAIGLSLFTSLAATLITVFFGTPLAYALARNAFRRHRLIDTLIDMPIVLPPAVAGVALLVAFGRKGLFGGVLSDLGIDIAFTTFAVILAQVFIAAPFYIKAAKLGFAAIDWEIEQAAGLDGANPWQAFRFVIVPLAWASLLGGSVMTWARAMGEFGATIIFAGNFPGRTQTMPLAIYLGFELNLEVALTLSVILVAFSFLVLMMVKGILQREVLTF